MHASGDNANPQRRERKPLPDCLTRLLRPEGVEADYVAQPARPASAAANGRTYARVLAAIWLDLDRLAQLADETADPAKPA